MTTKTTPKKVQPKSEAEKAQKTVNELYARMKRYSLTQEAFSRYLIKHQYKGAGLSTIKQWFKNPIKKIEFIKPLNDFVTQAEIEFGKSLAEILENIEGTKE